MFVSRSMTRNVITVDQEAGILDAQELMAENKIRHLPVIDNNKKFIGIVTDRDIRSALPYHFYDAPQNEKENIGTLKVKDIMTKDPISISPTYTIQDALLLIQNAKVGALPVVDDDRCLKGIISVRDLLRAFINVLGIGEPGTLLCILMEEKVVRATGVGYMVTRDDVISLIRRAGFDPVQRTTQYAPIRSWS